MSDAIRQLVPDNYRPSRYHVDVWRSASELDAPTLASYRAVLDEDERARAARFRFDARRNEFIVARGLLRCVLGAAMGIEPAAVRFDYSAKGKPRLSAPGEKRAEQRERETDLRFNVSHSHGQVLVAVTVGREVGVDIEKMRVKTDCEKLAARFFSPGEVEALRRVPAEDRRAAFFTCWTRKEAFLKATGKGITFGLDQFDVAFWPATRAALLSTRFDLAEAARWSMFNLGAPEGFAGSVAVEGRDVTLRCREV